MGAFGFGLELAPRGRRLAGFDFSAGVLPPGATLTRASAGARYDAAGTVVRAAAGEARFDYDPATPTAPGLLIESAATNLILYSEQFDSGAGWTATTAAIAANAATAPDGSATADQLVTGPANAVQTVAAASVAFMAGTAYTWSLFAKRAGSRFLQLRFPVAIVTNNNRYASFDLQTGSVAAVSSGVTAAVQALGDGWARCQATKTAEASASGSVLAGITQTGVAAGEAFAGDGVSGLLLWGAQLEAGTSASSQIVTTSASAARAAEAVTLDWGAQGIGDGAITVRYTFDDGSTQDVATNVAGGTATVPVNLNRRRLKRADKI